MDENCKEYIQKILFYFYIFEVGFELFVVIDRVKFMGIIFRRERVLI